MSKSVRGNRRRANGRVTPSKLRRNTVIAVDGVLAIGTGAIGGLFATGMGTGATSAAAPHVGWSTVQSPTVTGPDAPSANPETEFRATSSASSVFSAAAGEYATATTGRGLLETLSGGTWTAQEAPLPSDAGAQPDTTFKDVSCPTNGWCVAVGGYMDTSGNIRSMFDVLSGGRWTATETPLPPGSVPRIGDDLGVLPARGVLHRGTLFYYNGSGNQFGLIDTLSNGTWSQQVAPQTSDATTNQMAELLTVSCPTTNFCGAGGNYQTSAGGTQVEVLQESNGAWAVRKSAAAFRHGDAGQPEQRSQLNLLRRRHDVPMVGRVSRPARRPQCRTARASRRWRLVGLGSAQPAGGGTDGGGTLDSVPQQGVVHLRRRLRGRRHIRGHEWPGPCPRQFDHERRRHGGAGTGTAGRRSGGPRQRGPVLGLVRERRPMLGRRGVSHHGRTLQRDGPHRPGDQWDLDVPSPAGNAATGSGASLHPLRRVLHQSGGVQHRRLLQRSRYVRLP